jgi:hypothetical protein
MNGGQVEDGRLDRATSLKGDAASRRREALPKRPNPIHHFSREGGRRRLVDRENPVDGKQLRSWADAVAAKKAVDCSAAG